jgi:hypothetical protein
LETTGYTKRIIPRRKAVLANLVLIQTHENLLHSTGFPLTLALSPKGRGDCLISEINTLVLALISVISLSVQKTGVNLETKKV